jgi:glycosyltransferase involved in cell wall biosynthesis
MARICFFARVADRAVLERVEFYAQDIAILKDLGHDVIVATRPTELVRADLYFCWWWTWAFVPLTLARLLRRPAIVTGVFDEWMFDSRPWPMRLLLRYSLRAADTNIFISELERAVVPARFRVRDPQYSPCIVDTNRYRPAPGAPKERFLLTVAWLHADNARRKGISELVQALALVLARHPDVRWIHCGERGSGYRALEALVDSLNLSRSVEFRGVVSSEEKTDLMQRCAVYVQPSRFEGFGLAVLEAMACGAPVVASRGGALSEVVGDAGLLLDDLSPETIAGRIGELLDDPAAAASLGERARARAEHLFSFPRRRADIERAIAAVMLSRG